MILWNRTPGNLLHAVTPPLTPFLPIEKRFDMIVFSFWKDDITILFLLSQSSDFYCTMWIVKNLVVYLYVYLEVSANLILRTEIEKRQQKQESFTVVPLSLFLDLPRSLHKESRHPDCLLSRPMRWGWESKHCYTGCSISNRFWFLRKIAKMKWNWMKIEKNLQ